MLGRYTTGPGSEREEYQGARDGSPESASADEANHPVRLMAGKVTHEPPIHRLCERDRGFYCRERRYRNLRGTARMRRLCSCPVAQMESLVADDPLVRDRIVVVQDECDWPSVWHSDGRRIKVRVADPDLNTDRCTGDRVDGDKPDPQPEHEQESGDRQPVR